MDSSKHTRVDGKNSIPTNQLKAFQVLFRLHELRSGLQLDPRLKALLITHPDHQSQMNHMTHLR